MQITGALDHSLREGMFRSSFRTCGKAEDTRLSERHVVSIAADDVGDGELPARERSGLIKHDSVDVLSALEVLTTLDEDTVLGA